MDTPFPFGLSLPSAVYSSLLAVTFAVHLLAAQFLLAGSAFVAWEALRDSRAMSPLRALVVDWLPFAMGVTITLGVAPLLFLQIVDQQAFYTANLLLFHRWMAVLPVLVGAFYLLYLQKACAGLRHHAIWGRVIPVAVFLCVVFVGFSWSENHLLAGQREKWTGFYGEGALFFRTPELLPRFGTMLAAAFPGLAVAGAWMVRYLPEEDSIAVRRLLHRLALGGVVAATALALLTSSFLGPSTRTALLGTFGMPWLVAMGVGLVATAAVLFSSPGRLRPGPLTTTWGLFLLGLAFVREVLRWSRLDPTVAARHHQHAWGVGGLGVFAFFAVLLVGLAGWCLLRTRRDLRRSVTGPSPRTR